MSKPDDDRRPIASQDDPDAPISEEEARAAEDLRLALEDPARPSEEAALLRALANAHAPRDLDAAAHRALVESALARGGAKVVSLAMARRRRGAVVTVVTGVIAVAAGLVLYFGPLSRNEPAAPAAPVAMRRSGGAGGGAAAGAGVASARVPLVQVRSTQPLFKEPFAATGGTSARIDRIASAREADLRANQFARWGVK